MKKQEVRISITINNKDSEDFNVIFDVPNSFEKWDYEKKIEYLEKNIDKIERMAKKEMYISLSRFYSPIDGE